MTRGIRRRVVLGVAVMVGLLALAACGGGEPTSDAAGGDRAPATQPPARLGGDLAALARWANEQGMSGLSPGSLRPPSDERTLVIEVAETGSRFVPDEHFADDAGVPTRGSVFVTEGYVYVRGTLTCSDGTCDGVVYDEQGNPSPEFPERLLGTWTCYGTHIADAATAVTGPLVATTQVFDLGAVVGEQTVVTNGFELVDVGAAVERAIVGGTGRFASGRGVETQTLLGLNNPDLVIDGVPFFGVSLAVELEVH